jgi:hypothetical protein
MRLGIIARSDNTGLGNQTRELVNMLKPDKILLIDSSYFNSNKQNPDWYKDFNYTVTKHGMATQEEVYSFLDGLDIVLSCEIFYNNAFVNCARKKKVKTVLQYNYEFLDYLQNSNLMLPNVLLSPSMWNFDRVTELFGDKANVIYLPPPTNTEIFNNSKENNLSKNHNRILHVAGKIAAKDRNGTNTVIEMLKYSKADYELVIKAQSDFTTDCTDPRLTIDLSSPESREDLYSGFDAMVLPRRYAGLCLPMNEALLSALPVFMTDISPNNFLLPKEWLAESNKIDTLMTREMLDIYEADPKHLANIIDEYMLSKNKEESKRNALNIGELNFSSKVLEKRYHEILGLDL